MAFIFPKDKAKKTAPRAAEHGKVERLSLSDVGELTKKERTFIKGWLLDNFCDEDSYACELYEYEDGGLVLEDPRDNVGGDDSAFGVHLVGEPSGGSFFVLLFESLLEGVIYDRKAQKTAGVIIEGALTDVARGYDETALVVFEQVPGLAPPKRSKPKGSRRTARGPATSTGGPATLAEWRALFPGAEEQKTIDAVVAGLKRGLKSGGYLFTVFANDTGLPLKKQPQDPFKWLSMAQTLVLNTNQFEGLVPGEVGPLAIFTQLKRLELSVEPRTELSALGQLTNLVELSIDGGEQADWEWLGRLDRLETLSVAGNDIALESKVPAQRLCVKDNQRLQKLSWSGNIFDLSHLGCGPQLTWLDLNGPIQDLSPLRKATGLEVLNLRFCDVSDLTPLTTLKNLQVLDLNYNRLTSLAGIEKMKQLRLFDADYNCISDFSPAKKWLRDQTEAEAWIKKTARTQLDLTSPAGQAVRDDWFNLKKWAALADHLEKQGDPLGKEVKLRLANEPSDLPWYWARGTLERDPSWQ